MYGFEKFYIVHFLLIFCTFLDTFIMKSTIKEKELFEFMMRINSWEYEKDYE